MPEHDVDLSLKMIERVNTLYFTLVQNKVTHLRIVNLPHAWAREVPWVTMNESGTKHSLQIHLKNHSLHQ